MLQQTGVSTVLPYFPRFLKAFPTIRRLAAAPLERVLEQWAGLGYYARARNLQATAKILVKKCGGRLPRNRAEVLELPGVGPYTAGALLSFTYDLPEPLVDGNVVRVLSRMFGIKGDPRRPAILKKLWEKARSLVPSRGARDFNSALMDFGATVCKPGVPECAVCPMTALCWAYRNNWVDRLPVSRRKGVQPIVTLRAFLVEKDGRVLLRRRPSGGLWGGLWELPMEEGTGAAGVYSVGGERVEARRRLGRLRHVLSHRDLRVDLWAGVAGGKAPGSKWVPLSAARRMAISSLTKKLLSAGEKGKTGETPG